MAIGFVIVMALFALGDAAYAGYLWLKGTPANFETYIIAIVLAAAVGFMVFQRHVREQPPKA